MQTILSPSLSKGKNSNRSKFFSKLMGILAGDFGNSLSDAFVEGDAEKVAKMCDQVKAKLLKALSEKKGHGS